jgi:hypothetical protein
MLRFVCHFVAYMPKDAAILSVDEGGGLKGWPRWMLPYIKGDTHVRAPDGQWLRKALGDLAPEFGPLDALKGRDPKAVEELLTRLDDRWDYSIVTLCDSGPIGNLLTDVGQLRPIRLRSGGTEIGSADAVLFQVARIVRVDRVVGGGRALLQTQSFFASTNDILAQGTGDASERTLGAPCPEGGHSAFINHYYRTAAGVRYPDVVSPGIQSILTVDLGRWEKQQGPTHN